MATLAWTFLVRKALAQDEGAEGVPPEALAETSNGFNLIYRAFFENETGMVFMWGILILLLLGFAIILERLFMILFVYEANAAGLMEKTQRLILENNIEEAVKLANSKKKASIYQVFKAALVKADRPFEEIQDNMEVANLSVVPKLQQRLPYLFTIANVATLMGLLGTIAGLIITFDAVASLEGTAKNAALSSGIAAAMYTTGFGLVVAIPCMLVYGFLYNRINSIVDEIDHYSARLLMLLKTGSEYFENFSADENTTTEQHHFKRASSSQEETTGETSRGGGGSNVA